MTAQHEDPHEDPRRDQDPEHGLDEVLLQARPVRIAIWAGIASALMLTASIVIGLLLRGTNTGVHFGTYDQFALIGTGVILSALIMTAARPRLRVTRDGMKVRNVLGETFFPWPVVHRIGFPQGHPWAQVVLAEDETHPLMAIQTMDRERALTALRRLRELHAQYAPEQVAAAQAQAQAQARRPLPPEPDRPLGRLEIIDRQKAAQRAGKSGKGRK
ncbi:PH domain-containing protein [Nakamurella leprariae]|uniref:PH domain-containing protein n=1 Tax=Nakamurella leprariae TaxID=2803911 RepID=A0A938YH75_9ACTN|nr:PH domain-containing protein [Nakamurella leprariae]MBM9467750.1 PH domain-containing protein [Nakamurella leprariae]